jgi:hypothetical protein
MQKKTYFLKEKDKLAKNAMGGTRENVTKDINEMIFETATIWCRGFSTRGTIPVIADCWSERRETEYGQLVADHVKFPHG